MISYHILQNSCYNKLLLSIKFAAEQLKIVLLNLFVGGTMTTFLTLRWALKHLSQHQDVQKTLQNELQEAVGSARLPTFQVQRL